MAHAVRRKGSTYTRLAMAITEDLRRALADQLRRQGYERRDQPFRLTSGGTSRDYVDGKFAVSDGPSLRRAAEAVVEEVGTGFEAIGGPTMGADALAHAVALVARVRWFSVRKEAKGHGRQAWVEGCRLATGERVVVVDDVVSTGGSLLRAVDRLADLGAEVVAATTLLDRSPEVGRRFADRGIPWKPLLTWADLGIDPL
jgi:orotate phosphoribosyltransferase